MKLMTEEIKNSSRVLFIFQINYPIISFLKQKLENYQFEITSSTTLPESADEFKYIFIFDDKKNVDKILTGNFNNNIVIIFFGKKKVVEKLSQIISKNRFKKIKMINIDNHFKKEELAEKILWFILTPSNEQVLNTQTGLDTTQEKLTDHPKKNKFGLKINKKRVFGFLIFCFFLTQIFFVFPLAATAFFMSQGFKSLSKYDINSAKNHQKQISFYLSLTKSSYKLSRPMLSFLSLSLLPDSLISLCDSGSSFIANATQTAENGQYLVSLVLKNDKSPNELKELIARFKKLELQTQELSKELTIISQKLNYKTRGVDNFKKKLLKTVEFFHQINKILSHADSLIGGKTEKKYLLLFENNMELRPGGGFIGSFGIATFSNYTLKDLTVEDVYTADGQLEDHIEPPEAIKKYLNQPNWFLRDSAFSPDFPTNVEKASFFLENELAIGDFKGTVGITTTAINYILEAFGEIYLPDYDEIVNSDNFYIKTQTRVEKDFFAGSTQKKNFLSSLVKIMLIKLETVSLKDLGEAIKKSLDEKQIVLYLEDENLKREITTFGWDGKVITPGCSVQFTKCIADNFFAFDANLGVNKANFFVSRVLNLNVRIKDNEEIENNLKIIFVNDSESSVFPGGTYKNYFQVYLPFDSKIAQVTKNGTLINDYDEKSDSRLKLLSYYFELLPQKKAILEIKYTLSERISKGKNIYQLIVQKQIGALNNDFNLEISLPPKIHVLNQNFPAVAKNGGLIYNTNLSTDRIFFIELIKE